MVEVWHGIYYNNHHQHQHHHYHQTLCCRKLFLHRMTDTRHGLIFADSLALPIDKSNKRKVGHYNTQSPLRFKFKFKNIGGTLTGRIYRETYLKRNGLRWCVRHSCSWDCWPSTIIKIVFTGVTLRNGFFGLGWRRILWRLSRMALTTWYPFHDILYRSMQYMKEIRTLMIQQHVSWFWSSFMQSIWICFEVQPHFIWIARTSK